MNKTIHRGFSKLFATVFHISKREQFIALLIFTIFTVVFCNFQIVTAWSHHGDTAFLMEVLTSIKETGVPTTHLGPAFYDAFSTFTLYAEKVCQSELMAAERGVSILDVHAYYILYPLAALTWLFSPHVILAVANGLAFTSIIFISYWVIRRQGVTVLGAIAFCLLVMAHPAWSHAQLGDFYADRFFMPLALLYVALMYDAITRQSNISQNYLLLILAVGLLAASTTERGAVMVSLFTMTSLVLYWKRIVGHGYIIILTVYSVALLVCVILYVKLLNVQHAGTGNIAALLQGIPGFFDQLKAPVYAAKVQEFIVINVVLFGIFAFFNWRLALIAFGTLLPNILTTMGGAEKTGWSTHYHSMYFPFLVFASAIGFSKLWVFSGATKYRLILVGILMVMIPVISKYSPGYGGQQGAVMRLYEFYSHGESNNYDKTLSSQLKQIAAAIPAGAKVTTPEGFMPALYRDRTISFYPLGLDNSDYAVLSMASQSDGSFYYAGVVNYIAGESEKADICLTQRLRIAGYNVDRPKLIVGNVAVLERKNK